MKLPVVMLIALGTAHVACRATDRAATPATPACATFEKPDHESVATRTAPNHLELDTIATRSLEHNRLGETPCQEVVVYLPPGYAQEKARRYPTVYLLHGIAGSFSDWVAPGYSGHPVDVIVDSLVALRRIEPMIVVMPMGRGTHFLGAYYSNSPASGNWEDYVARELVAYVDARYRTIADRDHRAVAGHSMGGFGAVRMGMRHPDVFSGVYAMAPCCLAPDIADLSAKTNPKWKTAARMHSLDELAKLTAEGDAYPAAIVSLVAAMSLDSTAAPFYERFPHEMTNDSSLREIAGAHASYVAHFPVNEAAAYRANLLRLKGFRIDYGVRDDFPHIPPGSDSLAAVLTRLGVPFVLERYDGDHRDRIAERLGSRVLPFLDSLFRQRYP